jgi:hypothetical protein
MFVGHYGVAFAAKRVAPRVPLWVYFVAVQWLDVVWSLLVLLGIEKSSYGPSGVSAEHPAVRSARLAGRRIAIAIGTVRASA